MKEDEWMPQKSFQEKSKKRSECCSSEVFYGVA